jgi:hypothetical protein
MRIGDDITLDIEAEATCPGDPRHKSSGMTPKISHTQEDQRQPRRSNLKA